MKAQVKKQINFDVNDCSIYFNKAASNNKRGFVKTSEMTCFSLWKTILKELSNSGFKLYKKEDWYRNGDRFCMLGSKNYDGCYESSGFKLQFETELTNVGFTFHFFQDHNIENKSGGRYDFNKFEKMPFLVKIMMKKASAIILKGAKRFYSGFEYSIKDERNLTSEQKVINHFNGSSFTRNKLVSLSEIKELHSNDYKNCHNNLDRDKKEIECGDLKYFYDYSGVLSKGIVYHNINNMWWVISNDSKYSNISSFSLFDLTDEHIISRTKKRDNMPSEIKEMYKGVEKASSKCIVSELRKRGYKVAK